VRSFIVNMFVAAIRHAWWTEVLEHLTYDDYRALVQIAEEA
jgi:hypothetical protein